MSPDTTFSLSVLIAIAGCFVGLAGWLHSRDTKISEDAEWKGTVNTKLDLVIGLRKDYSDLSDKLNDLNERVGRIEELTKGLGKTVELIVKK